MKALIRHSLSIGTRLAVGLVLLVALTVSAVRITLPMLSERVSEVAALLSEVVGQPIEIAEVRADWTIWGPLLRLSDVGIYDPSGERKVLNADRLSLQVDIWRSLFHRQLVPKEIVVAGTALEIHRLADTSVRIVGLDLADVSLQTDPTVDPWSGLQDLAYQMTRSRIRWRDDITGTDYSFDDVSLFVDLKPTKGRLLVKGFVTLPEELGESLSVVFDLQGDPLAPRGWRGRHYFHAVGLRLAGLPPELGIRRLGLADGMTNVELWGTWAAGDLVDLKARLEAREVSLSAGHSEGAPDPPRFAGVDALLFATRLDQGWRFDIEDLRVRRQGLEWGPTGISIETQRMEGGEQWSIGADFVRVQDLVPTLLTRSEFPGEYRRLALDLSPQGDLRDLRLTLRFPINGPPVLTAQGEFQDLGFSSLAETPGVTGLAGAFSLHGRAGEVALASDSVEIDYPALFARPHWVDSLSGTIRWTQSDTGYVVTAPLLEASNQDIEAQSRLRLEIGQDGPLLDMQVNYGRGDVERAGRYLPFTLSADVDSWLRRAMVSGRVPEGQMVFHGRIADYPFRGGEGVFEARFSLADAVLAYDPNWPVLTDLNGELVFRNSSFRADLRSGNAFRLLVEEAKVEIPDFDDPRVLVEVSSHGPLSDVFRFLRESPLREGQEDLLADVETQGLSRLTLNIDLPLDEAKMQQTKVRGRLDLRGCSLGLRSADLYFGAIEGALDFDEQGFSIDQITADFGGDPVTLTASTGSGGMITVDVAGNLRTSNLLNTADPFISQRVNGRSYWLARLNLPGFAQANGESSTLRLQSDLVGTEVQAPEPLGKTAQESRDFVLETGLTSDSALELRYGQHSAALELESPADGSTGIRRGEFRFNDRGAKLPARGIAVKGSLPRVSLSEWQAVLAPAGDAPTSGRRALGEAFVLDGLSDLDFSADEVELWGHEIRSVRVNAVQDKGGWRGLVSTSALSGTVRLPSDMKSGVPLVMELEHLTIEDSEEPAELPRPDPRDLPAMRITSKTLVWGGRRFEDLHLEATRVSDGLVIHKLGLTAPHLALRVNGDWRVTGVGSQRSTIRLEAESDDFGAALKALDLESGLTGGKGKLTANLRWPDAPTRAGWTGLEGTGQLDVEKGRFEDLDPGAGRLLGLINLQFLPRRLTLDFSDIFKEGYSFDTIAGNYTFRGSDIFTTDTEIIGPAADVGISGRTNVEAREYDQVVTITPHVKSALPIAGFLVGGLPVGAAVFLADTVFNIGKGLDRASRIKYRVTGSWEDPQVEVLSAPEPDSAFPNDESEFPRE